MDQIVSELHSNNIILISGPTGSGKSTGVPKLLIENFKDSKILVAQPRRLGAESLCNRMRQLLQPKLVGLRMGFGVKDEYPETRLWYMTVGYIVRLLINNINYLSPGDILIFDEIHESGLDQDLLCFLAKILLSKNVKLILMSATINLEHYQNYFGDKIPMIVIGKKPFPISVYYLDELDTHPDVKLAKAIYKDVSSTRQLELALLVIESLQESVLVFLSGLKDMYLLAEMLQPKNINYVLLHSQIERPSDPFQNQTFTVYLATNIAESSITIPDLNLVICLGKEKYVNNGVLRTRFISWASATQRAGRTGRTCPGTLIRLYTRETYNYFETYYTEYSTQQLAQIILQLEMLNSQYSTREILTNLPSPIDEFQIEIAYQKLENYHMMEEGEITSYGIFANKIGIDLEYVNMLALGCQLGCANTVACLVANMVNPPYVMHSYLDPKYLSKVRKYAYKRFKTCYDSEPIYNLLNYQKNPKKFKYITRVYKTLSQELPQDKLKPTKQLLYYIIGISWRNNWLDANEHQYFKNHSVEIKNLPEIVKQPDENVFTIYSIIYYANYKDTFSFLDQNLPMYNKAYITEKEVLTWHPEIVYDPHDQMNYVNVIFKRREKTNRIIKKLKKKKIDLLVTQKEHNLVEFIGLETKFNKKINSKNIISYFLNVNIDNITYAPMLINTIARGYRDKLFRLNNSDRGIKIRYPSIYWKCDQINIWLPSWESSVINKKIAVPTRILLSEGGNGGRAFNITFLDYFLFDLIENVQPQDFTLLDFNSEFYQKLIHKLESKKIES